jgi:hypothetical protein
LGIEFKAKFYGAPQEMIDHFVQDSSFDALMDLLPNEGELVAKFDVGFSGKIKAELVYHGASFDFHCTDRGSCFQTLCHNLSEAMASKIADWDIYKQAA